MRNSESQQTKKEKLLAWLQTLSPTTRMALLSAAREKQLEKKQVDKNGVREPPVWVYQVTEV